MQNQRVWLVGGSVVAVLIMLSGWFFMIQPELTAASSDRDRADEARTQNIVLAGKNSRLKAHNDDIAGLRAGLTSALAALPFDSGLPEFTDQVSAQATENSMLLSSIVVGNAAPVEVPTSTEVADASSGGEQAATDSTGLVAIPLTLVATGLAENQQAFLTALQVTGPRRALVTAVQVAPPSGGGEAAAGGEAAGGAESTLTVQLTVFSDPLPPQARTELEKLITGA